LGGDGQDAATTQEDQPCEGAQATVFQRDGVEGAMALVNMLCHVMIAASDPDTAGNAIDAPTVINSRRTECFSSGVSKLESKKSSQMIFSKLMIHRW
jgi:hypothetical protein